MAPAGRRDMAVTICGKAFIMEFKAGERVEEALQPNRKEGLCQKMSDSGIQSNETRHKQQFDLKILKRRGK